VRKVGFGINSIRHAWLLIAGDWQTNHTHTKHDYSHLA
jgi:hypothetical protein